MNNRIEKFESDSQFGSASPYKYLFKFDTNRTNMIHTHTLSMSGDDVLILSVIRIDLPPEQQQ